MPRSSRNIGKASDLAKLARRDGNAARSAHYAEWQRKLDARQGKLAVRRLPPTITLSSPKGTSSG